MSHPNTEEWDAAINALLTAIDLPADLLAPIRDLIDPSLGRLFFRYWQQDANNEAGEPGDGSSADLDRKWRVRAEAWYDVYGISVSHVIDWFIVACETNQKWLYNIDDRGHPKKLLKCGSLERLVIEANKGLRHRSKVAEIIIGSDDEVCVADLGDGYRLVQLMTPNALRREGHRMHNCLRHGDHGTILTSTLARFLSVRDPNDKPLGTLEVHIGYVRQFAGPCNQAPKSDVIDRVIPIATAWNWSDLYTATLDFPEEEDDEESTVPIVSEIRRRI